LSTGLAQDFKELVRSHTDLVALIGESLTLQPHGGGREYKGLCPFHDDTNPSLTVSPERQSYKCWACNEGGDCFSWVMQRDGLGFAEALRYLAERAGLEMPKQYRRGGGGRKTKDDLYQVLAWAETQFHQFYKTAEAARAARDYIAGRGFSRETVERFRLGFHPRDWQWILDRARGTYSTEQLLAAGLVVEQRDGSGYRDDLYGRVLFPIHDERGRVVAFGGRILPGDDAGKGPKYLNGRETAIFSKSKLLYGLDVARDAIRKQDEVLVTEGYTDCITAAQHGVENVVATLGTSLTELHVQLLQRFARKVVLVFDGDTAGQKASVRSVAKFLAQDVDLRILTLPPGQDPADFLNEQGREAFRELVDNAVEAWEFRLQAAVSEHTLNSVDARHRVLEDMLELLAAAPNLGGTPREDAIIHRLVQKMKAASLSSEESRYSESRIRRRLNDLKRRASSRAAMRTDGQPLDQQVTGEESGRSNAGRRQSPGGLSLEEAVERELLELIFAHPPLIETIRERVATEEIQNTVLRELFQRCCDLWEQGFAPEYEKVTSAVEDQELKRWATEIDELARRKKTAAILREDGTLQGVPPPTSLLEQLMAQFDRRRRIPSSRPEEAASTAGLTPEAKHRLRELTELRQTDPHIRLKSPTGRKR